MKEVIDLENAILAYIDSDKSALIPFYGECKDFEPFGDKELGNIINDGNVDNINQKLNEINFSEINFGLFDNKPKYKSEGDKYFDLTRSFINKIDGKNKAPKIFKKTIDYILTQYKKNKDFPLLPEVFRNVGVTRKEWDNLLHMLN